MKKIFLAVTVILIVGLFVGCASTPNTSITPKKNPNEIFNGVYDESIGDIYDDIYWKETQYIGGTDFPIVCDLDKVFKLRKSSDYDQQYKVQNTFNKIIKSKKISGRDYYKLFWCHKFMSEDKTKNYFTLKDFLNENEETKINSITGKIINNSNETLFIGIYTRRQEQRHFYFEIKPHEEKYFKIPKISELKESFIGIEDKYMNDYTRIGIASPDYYNSIGETDRFERLNNDLQEHFFEYIFSNYSFEMTFEKNIPCNSWKENIGSWILVPRYETEENILTEALSYREIESIFSKYR